MIKISQTCHLVFEIMNFDLLYPIVKQQDAQNHLNFIIVNKINFIIPLIIFISKINGTLKVYLLITTTRDA